MALTLDTSRSLRSDAQLRALAQSVFDAHPSDEKHFLEWKGYLELGSRGKEAHFAVAKCVLAMANRPVATAATYFDGCGYMVIGVEPEKVHEVEIPDMANLEPWVTRFTGHEGPTWSGHTVQFQEHTVLVVIVEAPRDGDHIFPLAREWAPDDRNKKGHQAGTIFVRHQGRSEPASAADIRALENRLLAGTGKLQEISGLRLAPSIRGAVQALEYDHAAFDAAVVAERQRLTIPAEYPTPTGRVSVMASPPAGELERYIRERDDYLREYRNALPDIVLHRALVRREGRLRLAVTNGLLTPLHDVRIRLQFPKGLAVFEEAADIQVPHLEAPLPPAEGIPTGTLAGLMTGRRLGAYRIDSSDLGLMQRHLQISPDHSLLTLSVDSIHPQEVVETDSFVLLTGNGGRSEVPETVWSIQASITAGDRSGVFSTVLEVEASEIAFSVSGLLRRD